MGGKIIELEAKNQTGRAAATVIVMHGLGDSADGWAPVARQLQADARLAHCRFVLPTAPTQPVTINGGHAMPSWYDIVSLSLEGRQNDRSEGLDASMRTVRALVDAEVARGVAIERIVLMGFSQGAALAISTAYRHPSRLAAVVALSGYLPRGAESVLEIARTPGSHSTPLLMAHGTADAVVPIEYARMSFEALKTAGVSKAQFREYPGLGHSLGDQEYRDVADFLSLHVA